MQPFWPKQKTTSHPWLLSSDPTYHQTVVPSSSCKLRMNTVSMEQTKATLKHWDKCGGIWTLKHKSTMLTLSITFKNAIGLEPTSASTMGFQRKCIPMQELWNLKEWFSEDRSTLDGSLIGDKATRGKLWKDTSRSFSFCWAKTTLFLCIWFMEAPTLDLQLEPIPKTKICTQAPSQHTTMRLLSMSKVQLTRNSQHTETWWKNI